MQMEFCMHRLETKPILLDDTLDFVRLVFCPLLARLVQLLLPDPRPVQMLLYAILRTCNSLDLVVPNIVNIQSRCTCSGIENKVVPAIA